MPMLYLFFSLLSVILLLFPFLQGADGELDPEDDPNNQGEDEFEEAEDERPQHRVAEEEDEGVEEEEEPAAPAQHIDKHQGPEQPAVEEELVVSKGVRERRRSNKQELYLASTVAAAVLTETCVLTVLAVF